MRTICSREIFTKNYRQQQNFDSDPNEAWHYNHSDRQKFYAVLQIDLYVIHAICQTYDQSKGGGSVHTSANLIFHFSNKNGKRKYYLSLSYLHISKYRKVQSQENRSFFHFSNFEFKFKNTKILLMDKSDILLFSFS